MNVYCPLKSIREYNELLFTIEVIKYYHGMLRMNITESVFRSFLGERLLKFQIRAKLKNCKQFCIMYCT